MPQPSVTSSAVKRAVLGVKFRCNSLAPADPWDLRDGQTAPIGTTVTLSSTGRMSSCTEGHRHRGVCLKLLSKLASRLGLGQPCGIADLKRTSTCRQLLSGSLLDAHLTWCRHLLEAYDCLRQDRDDLALRCSEQIREAAQLEGRIQQLDRQLAEARQQFERLQTAATAASQTLQGQHDSQNLRLIQRVRSDTRNISPNAQDLRQLIAHWEDCRETSSVSQHEQLQVPTKPKPLQLKAISPGDSSTSSIFCGGGGSGSSGSPLASVGTFNSAVSGRYHPPESRGKSRIPLPVWYKTSSGTETPNADNTGAEAPCQPEPQHLGKKPKRDKESTTARRSRATNLETRRQRHRRSQTYDKLTPELLDRWQQLLAPTVDEDN